MLYTVVEVMKMAKTANLNIRIDPEIKAMVDGIYSRFGISIADAVNIFLHKSIMVGGLPFDMNLSAHNEASPAAMPEIRGIASNKIKSESYSSLQEVIDEIIS